MDSGEVGKDPLNNNRRVSYVEVFLWLVGPLVDQKAMKPIPSN